MFLARARIPAPRTAAIVRFIEAALWGTRPLVYGDGEQSRDFTYVENIVQANLLAEMDGGGGCRTRGTGERHTLNELLRCLSAILGRGLEPEFSGAQLGDVRDSQAGIEKARRFLGFNYGVLPRGARTHRGLAAGDIEHAIVTPARQRGSLLLPFDSMLAVSLFIFYLPVRGPARPGLDEARSSLPPPRGAATTTLYRLSPRFLRCGSRAGLLQPQTAVKSLLAQQFIVGSPILTILP